MVSGIRTHERVRRGEQEHHADNTVVIFGNSVATLPYLGGNQLLTPDGPARNTTGARCVPTRLQKTPSYIAHRSCAPVAL